MYLGYSPARSPLSPDQIKPVADQLYEKLDGANYTPGPFRNHFINASMEHWQRGTGPTNYYGADRWLTYIDSGTLTSQRLALAYGEAGSASRYAVRLTQTSRSGQSLFGQRLERCDRFSGKRIMFRARARASAPTNLNFRLEVNYGTGGSGANFLYGPQPLIGTTFATFTAIWDVPDYLTGKILGSNNDDSVGVYFGISNTANLTIDVTDFEVLEVVPGYGDQAPGYERIPRELDFLRCQRYYETSPDLMGMWVENSPTAYLTAWSFVVPKRVTPSILLKIMQVNRYGIATSAVSSIYAVGNSPRSTVIVLNTDTQKAAAMGNQGPGTYAADAEL